jgi:hypothetical protein
VLAILLAVIVFALTNGPSTTGSGPTASRSAGPSPSTSPTAPAVDGMLAFTVDSVTCGVKQVGSGLFARHPKGQYCLVRLVARNTGNDSRTLTNFRQYLYDDRGKQHAADYWARYEISGENIWNAIPPGSAAAGTMVFDIPVGARPARLVLHDGLLSNGVTIPL